MLNYLEVLLLLLLLVVVVVVVVDWQQSLPPTELPSESSPGAAGGPIVGLSGGLPSMLVEVVSG